VQATGSRVASRIFRVLGRLAGVKAPSANWRPLRAGTFDNSLGELFLEARSASATYRRSPKEGEDPERLVADRPLALAAQHDTNETPL
jgi:hypothetical protein